MPADKSIKISFAVDEQSARKSKTIIDDLTRSVQNLASVSSRVGNAVGSGSNVGGLTVRTGRQQPGGMGHMATPAGSRQTSGGGIVNQVLGVGDAAAMRQMMTASQQAFGGVANSVKSFVDATKREVASLQEAVDKLTDSMGALKTKSGGLRDTTPAGSTPAGSTPAGSTPAGSTSAGSTTRTPTPMLPHNGSPGGFRSHLFGMLGSGGNSSIGGIDKSGPLGFLNQASNMMGFSPVGMGIKSFMFGLNAANQGMEYLAAERSQRINQQLNQPFDAMSRTTAMSAPFRELHAAVQHRDISYVKAFEDALKDPKVMKSIGNSQLRVERMELDRLQGGTLSGISKDLWTDFRNWASKTTGATTDDAYQWLNARSPSKETRQLREIIRDNALSDLGPEDAAQFQQAVHNKRAQQDPTISMMANQVYGNALGRVQTLRYGGLSSGSRKRKNPDGTYTEVSVYEDLEQQLMRGGWTPGDYNSGHQQFLHIGSGYSRAGVGNIGLVSAGIGGLTNAADLLRVGGTIGGSVSGGGNYYRAAQSSIGRGGVDVAVGRDLFSQIGHHALATGQFGGTDAAQRYAQFSAGLIGGGTAIPSDVGMQQRVMGMTQQGAAELNMYSQGRAAPLYQGTSLVASVSAAGGYGYRSEFLNKMPHELLTTIARATSANDPTIPAAARAMGITPEMARSYLRQTDPSIAFEIQDALVPEGLKKSLGEYRSHGGDFAAAVKGRVGAKRRGETDRAYQGRRSSTMLGMAQEIGGLLSAANIASSTDAGAGMLLEQAKLDPELAPYLKGRGVGAAAPKGAEKEALTQQADTQKRHSETYKDVEEIITRVMKAVFAEKSADAGVNSLRGATGAGLTNSIGQVISALTNMSAELQKEQKMQPKQIR